MEITYIRYILFYIMYTCLNSTIIIYELLISMRNYFVILNLDNTIDYETMHMTVFTIILELPKLSGVRLKA